MIISANTIGTTKGGIVMLIDNEPMPGILSVDTTHKTLIRYVRDSNGNYVLADSEILTECVQFEKAVIGFDNVRIEVE